MAQEEAAELLKGPVTSHRMTHAHFLDDLRLTLQMIEREMGPLFSLSMESRVESVIIKSGPVTSK